VSREGENVVTGITAPGALIAYALIHMKSNDEFVAGKISMPTSFYLIDF